MTQLYASAKAQIDALTARYGTAWIEDRWARTIDRTCPFTGKEVTLADVLAGDYILPRIGGDSENGYEVWPSKECFATLMTHIS